MNSGNISYLKNQFNPRLVHALLSWFEEKRRDLPWRRDRGIYPVWVSEVMLQQTQVAKVIPYYERFMHRFPTISDLATAEYDEVLKLWEGLGYYQRARNLKRAAEIIMHDYMGVIPETYELFLTLPGVGAYIAAAVMSLALNYPVAVVDGNVLRVLSRVAGIQTSIEEASVKKNVQKDLNTIIANYPPAPFNESLMELGAIICTPVSPRCEQCPLGISCFAFANKKVDFFPVRTPRKKIPIKKIVVGIIFAQGRLYIQKRTRATHLGGLWEFPGGKVEKGESLEHALIREIKEETGFTVAIKEKLESVRHAYSHFKVEIHPFICEMQSQEKSIVADMHWIYPQEYKKFAFPGANHKIFSVMKNHGYFE